MDAGWFQIVRRPAQLPRTTTPHKPRSGRSSRVPIVVQSSKPFLDWDAMSRSNRRRALAEIDPATGAATVVVPPATMTNYQLSRDGSFVTWLEDNTEKTNYDVIFGTDNAVRALYAGGEAKTCSTPKTLKTITPRWSDDLRTLAYADKGEVFVQRIDEAKPRSITPKPQKDPAAPPPAAGDEPESFSVVSFSRDGSKLLITSKRGWYVASVADGARDRVLTLDDKNEEKNPKLTAVDWTPSGDAIFVQYGEPDRWDRGISRLDLKTKTLTTLARDNAVYQGFRMSRDGRTLIFQKSDGTRPADLYAADAGFANVRKLTDLNPWIATRALPASELVVLSRCRRQGALRRPALSRRLRERAAGIRRCSRFTKRSSTTASTAARRCSPATATRCFIHR